MRTARQIALFRRSSIHRRAGHVSSKLLKLVLLFVPALATAAPITLDQAIATSLERNASIRSPRAEADGARARARGASQLLRANPEFEGAFGARRAPGEQRENDLEVSVTQELEVFGQRAARRDAAEALLSAA